MAFRDKKDREDAPSNPFLDLDRSTVLQEARTFNDTPIKVRKCLVILTKILFVIAQGESIGATEATETFFAMTKLFQCQDTVRTNPLPPSSPPSLTSLRVPLDPVVRHPAV